MKPSSVVFCHVRLPLFVSLRVRPSSHRPAEDVDSPENQTDRSKRLSYPRVRQVDGVKKATPLLLCLICIELSDFVFAVDSIPAVLGISHDTFIVYASNVSFTLIVIFCCSATCVNSCRVNQ